ncbi:hypothetical protein HK101_004546 [Irineochytrium annulatum]|nr:hypothetical protein HK101_004546 [Irineochytrium annulatum]
MDVPNEVLIAISLWLHPHDLVKLEKALGRSQPLSLDPSFADQHLATHLATVTTLLQRCPAPLDATDHDRARQAALTGLNLPKLGPAYIAAYLRLAVIPDLRFILREPEWEKFHGPSVDVGSVVEALKMLRDRDSARFVALAPDWSVLGDDADLMESWVLARSQGAPSAPGHMVEVCVVGRAPRCLDRILAMGAPATERVLVRAVESGHRGILATLLDACKPAPSKTVLGWCAASAVVNDNAPALEMLLRRGTPEPRDLVKLMRQAAKEERPDLLELLIRVRDEHLLKPQVIAWPNAELASGLAGKGRILRLALADIDSRDNTESILTPACVNRLILGAAAVGDVDSFRLLTSRWPLDTSAPHCALVDAATLTHETSRTTLQSRGEILDALIDAAGGAEGIDPSLASRMSAAAYKTWCMPALERLVKLGLMDHVRMLDSPISALPRGDDASRALFVELVRGVVGTEEVREGTLGQAGRAALATQIMKDARRFGHDMPPGEQDRFMTDVAELMESRGVADARDTRYYVMDGGWLRDGICGGVNESQRWMYLVAVIQQGREDVAADIVPMFEKQALFDACARMIEAKMDVALEVALKGGKMGKYGDEGAEGWECVYKAAAGRPEVMMMMSKFEH